MKTALSAAAGNESKTEVGGADHEAESGSGSDTAAGHAAESGVEMSGSASITCTKCGIAAASGAGRAAVSRRVRRTAEAHSAVRAGSGRAIAASNMMDDNGG
jgi:hypothetical protein